MKWLLLPIALLSGVLIPFQSAMNARLTKLVTGSPTIATGVNTTIATLCLILVAIIGYSIGTLIERPIDGFRNAPWWVWIGGVLGAGYALSLTTLAPILGVSVMMGLAVTGQLIISAIIDHYGWMGMEQRSSGLAARGGCVVISCWGGVCVLAEVRMNLGRNAVDNDLPIDGPGQDGASRRDFLATSAAIGVGLVVDRTSLTLADGPVPESLIEITLKVNGKADTRSIDPRVTLLDYVRDRLGLSGSKKGCDHGQCGACTMLVGGRRINSCLTLAVMQQGKEITTIEGLANGDTLHPLQEAFIKHDGFQCGYCTPGQICSAVGLLKEGHTHDDAQIREMMSGNLCRCGAYTNIVAAIREVAGVAKR